MAFDDMSGAAQRAEAQRAAAAKAAAAKKKAAAVKAAAAKRAAASKASRGTSVSSPGRSTSGGGSGGSAPAGGAAKAAPATAANYDETASAKAANFGWSLAVINADPELKALFAQATSTGANGNWTTDHFVAKVRDTKWFKKNSDTARQAIILQKADPATYTSRVNAAMSQARTMAGTVGASLTAAQLNTIGAHSVMFGWNSDQLRQAMGSFVKAGTGGQYLGGAASYQNEYARLAEQYGVNVAPATMGKWISDSVISGSSNSDTVKNYMIAQAASRYPALAGRLNSGETLDQIADPYRQSYARILEVNPNTVKLMDPLIQAAMTGSDAKGQPSTKTLWQYENDLRQDPRYMKTQGAVDGAYAMAHRVLTDWGVVS